MEGAIEREGIERDEGAAMETGSEEKKGGGENEALSFFHSRRVTRKEGWKEGKKEDRRALIEDLDKDVDESEIDMETGELATKTATTTTASTSLAASATPPVKELTRKIESSLKLVDDDEDDVEVIVETAEAKTGFAEAKTPRNGANFCFIHFFFLYGRVARKRCGRGLWWEEGRGTGGRMAYGGQADPKLGDLQSIWKGFN